MTRIIRLLFWGMYWLLCFRILLFHYELLRDFELVLAIFGLGVLGGGLLEMVREVRDRRLHRNRKKWVKTNPRSTSEPRIQKRALRMDWLLIPLFALFWGVLWAISSGILVLSELSAPGVPLFFILFPVVILSFYCLGLGIVGELIYYLLWKRSNFVR